MEIQLKKFESIISLSIGIGLAVFLLYAVVLPNFQAEMAECIAKYGTCVVLN